MAKPFDKKNILDSDPLEVWALKCALRANQLNLRAVIAASGGTVRIPDDLWGRPPDNLTITKDLETNEIILKVD